MRFSPRSATSIDLHIHEIVRWSRFRRNVTVFAEKVAEPFDDVPARFWHGKARTQTLRRMMRDYDPSLIVVHQRLATASALARACREIPVALIRHNFNKPPRHWLSALLKRAQMGRLGAIAFVSEACRSDFAQNWRDVSVPITVVPNGIDCASWRPAPEKEKLILFVGHTSFEKGAPEAAAAIAAAVAQHEDWRGAYITPVLPDDSDCGAQVKAALARAGDRVTVVTAAAHDDVRAWMTRASIALAPTQTREAFGRVAAEALASGATLIATARGGFVEIAGDTAVLLDEPNAVNLSVEISRLIENPAERIRLARAGRARVLAHYDRDAAAAAFDRLVVTLLGRG